LYNIISNSIRYSHPDRKPIIHIQWIIDSENKINSPHIGNWVELVGRDKILGMYKTFGNHIDSKGIGLFG
jgi:hypothetical protein